LALVLGHELSASVERAYCSKEEYAKEAQAAAEAPDDAARPTPPTENGAASEDDLEAVVAM